MPKLDLWPILEQLTIKTKQARIQPLRKNDPFAWAQREFVREVEWQYNHGKPVRIIVLKGRQLGLSTVTEAILFIWAFLHPGANSLVLSKQQSDSEYLFGITKRYWDQGPFKGLVDTVYARKGYIQWDNGSSIMTETAKKEDIGRGRTLQAVHGSEVAFWAEADDIAGSLGEAVAYEHGTIIVHESTAQGVGGYFYDEWDKAIHGQSDFTPMFFPWWEHYEYEVGETHLKFRDLDDEERDLLAAYPKMTIPKLAWRRRKIQSYQNPETFKEEYPCSPEEAFLSTGNNIFPLTALKKIYHPDPDREQGYLYGENGKLIWVDSPTGHTFCYRRPDAQRQRRFVIGVDPTRTLEGDPACIQVLDRANMEQVCVWHGNADPDTIGEISLGLAQWYGPETILNTEIQGGGKEVMRIWRDAEYPHIWMDRRADRPRILMQALGWNSTYETKRQMLSAMQGAIIRGNLILHHAATFHELTQYVHDQDDDTYGPARRSGHDDCVTSLGVAMMTAVTEATSLDASAFAAPAPLYVPGQTPPHLREAARMVNPALVGGVQSWSMPGEDMMIGVDETY